MERESFEDDEVARLLNSDFVCIKVDREERPDIDAVYMTACQMLTGGGGWPLTILMTPEKEPFWAGTYLPKRSRSGMLGLEELLPRVSQLWKNDRSRLVSAAVSVVEALSQTPLSTSQQKLDATTLEEAYERLSAIYDEHGHGFGTSPKFPSPHNLLFLLRYWKRTHTQHALKMVTETLDAMSNGGIHDQIGGGFHRYSTDAEWKIPHFEKMLYDQATLLLAYTEAYQTTVDFNYASTARGIADYVLRDMLTSDCAFSSAEDADSEGEEGKFYTWTLKEFDQVLGEDDAPIAARIFGVSDSGNLREEPGANFLHIIASDEALPQEFGLESSEYKDKIASIRLRLLEARNKRVRPLLDDKVLTDWNGLMIAALSKAGAVLGDDRYVMAAEKCTRFILCKMNGETLLHAYRLGVASIPAFLDDYAYLIWGLIELYEANFKAEYLKEAARLTQDTFKLFWDPDLGGFYISRSSEGVLPRLKEAYDGAKPSGNSVMTMNLLRLGGFLGESIAEKTEKLFSFLAPQVDANTASYTYLLCALDYSVGPSYEVIVVCDPDSEKGQRVINTLEKAYLPNKLIMLKTPELDQLLEYTTSMSSIGGEPTLYVCRNRACKMPTIDVNEALKTLMTDEVLKN